MLVTSDNRDCTLEMFRTPNDQYHCTVRLTLGRHSLENDYIYLDNAVAFILSLRDRGKSRTGKAVLSGSEDFEISFGADGGSGAIAINAALTRNFPASSSRTGHTRMGKASLQGTFTVSGEFVPEMVREFEELLAGEA
jgi:hypothetical protein